MELSLLEKQKLYYRDHIEKIPKIALTGMMKKIIS